MATKKKVIVEDSEGVKEVVEPSIPAPETVENVEKPVENTEETLTVETKEEKSKTVEVKTSKKEPKYKIGSIVFVSKDADADLNGFKLFPQYKKYTYTVEAYDAISDVYSLRRLNLSLKLKESNIVAPSERGHDSINRKQF